MILPTRAEIVELNQNGTLLDAIFSDRWECRYLHFGPIAQELANAHNGGEIDLLEPFSCIALDGALDGEQNETEHGAPKRALNSFSDHRGYQGRRIYGPAIERLEACLPAVLKTLKILARLSAGEEYEATETLNR